MRCPTVHFLVVTCAQCREKVLEANRIGDEEECLFRDHLMMLHPNTIQPETRSVLLKHVVVTERPPPAASPRPAARAAGAQPRPGVRGPNSISAAKK
jgi:hypothetical protein